MRSRSLRAFFVLATIMVVWLVASPASASASEAPMSMMTTPSMSIAPKATLATTPSPAAPAPTPLDARAPLCDPRGAITFAPAPQMQELEVSLETSTTVEDCLAESRGERSAAYRVAPGRAPLPADALSSSMDAAVLTAVPTLAASMRESAPAPAASTSRSRPGFRSTVDRPPRA